MQEKLENVLFVQNVHKLMQRNIFYQLTNSTPHFLQRGILEIYSAVFLKAFYEVASDFMYFWPQIRSRDLRNYVLFGQDNSVTGILQSFQKPKMCHLRLIGSREQELK